MANLQLDSGLTLSTSALRADGAPANAQAVVPSPAVSANKQLVATIDNQLQQPLADKQAASESASTSDITTVQQAVEALNQSSTIRQTSLQFVFEERGDPPIVKVVDKDSGQEIRQIPSEVVQRIAKAIEEYADNSHNRSGILFDKQV